jgi:hypothetical protein
MTPPRSARLVVVVITGLVAAACGGSGKGGGATSRPASTASPQPQQGTINQTPNTVPEAIPAPRPTGKHANPADVTVIKAWSSALRHGDIVAAAGYFALPSEFVNGADASGNVAVLTIHTRAEAAEINATLPCGALFLSADQRGRYVNALFRLTNRPGPGGGCGAGTGQVARTNFLITAGHIVQWLRAPADPGDANRGGPPPSASPAPAAPPPTGAPAV